MTNNRLLIALAFAAGIIGGYFIGRAHLKHEMETAFTTAVAGFGEGLKDAFSEPGKRLSPNKKLEGTPSAQAANRAAEAKVKQEKLDYIREHLEVYEIKAERASSRLLEGKRPVLIA